MGTSPFFLMTGHRSWQPCDENAPGGGIPSPDPSKDCKNEKLQLPFLVLDVVAVLVVLDVLAGDLCHAGRGRHERHIPSDRIDGG
jgi:hypothetical protein